MTTPARVTALENHRLRSRRIHRVRAMQAALRGMAADEARESAFGGRAWINGREVGGTDPRHEHLAESYD